MKPSRDTFTKYSHNLHITFTRSRLYFNLHVNIMWIFTWMLRHIHVNMWRKLLS